MPGQPRDIGSADRLARGGLLRKRVAPVRERQREDPARLKLRRCKVRPTNAVCPREQRGGTVTERSERLLCEARHRSPEDPPIHFDG